MIDICISQIIAATAKTTGTTIIIIFLPSSALLPVVGPKLEQHTYEYS